MWKLLVIPFSYIMKFCYGLFNSYGIALFLYALITKIVLLPFSIKQQKSQLAMVRIKPFQDDLMKKYGGNKERYQQELMKLYEREGVNPTASCLPTLIQLPVILLIYTVVRRPLTHLAGMSLTEIWTKMQPYVGQGAFKNATAENFHQFELPLLSELSKTGAAGGIDAKFLGIDLGMIPRDFLQDGWFSASFWIILIPILAGVTSYLTTWISQKLNPTMQEGQGSMKMMNVMMPLVSVFFSFTYQGVLGFYWIASNIVSIAQVVILNKFYDPKKALAEVENKMKAQKEAEKEKRRLAAEKKAMYGSKNSKKKRAMNAQNVQKLKEKSETEPSDAFDTQNTQETEENGN